MFKHTLTTSNPTLKLVSPNVVRDSRNGAEWMAGQNGRCTLQLMGVRDVDNQPTTVEQEAERVQGFLDRRDQYNWMMQLGGEIVGAVWVDLEPTQNLGAPAVHIMIGDPGARGKGVGQATMKSMIKYLQSEGHKQIFSRHLITNQASAHMLSRLGFVNDDEPYVAPDDGLEWQNMTLTVN